MGIRESKCYHTPLTWGGSLPIPSQLDPMRACLFQEILKWVLPQDGILTPKASLPGTQMASLLLRQVFLVPRCVSGEKVMLYPRLDHISQQCSTSRITSHLQFGDLPWVPGPQLPEASVSWALISAQWAQHAPRTPTYLLLTQQTFLVAPF